MPCTSTFLLKKDKIATISRTSKLFLRNKIHAYFETKYFYFIFFPKDLLPCPEFFLVCLQLLKKKSWGNHLPTNTRAPLPTVNPGSSSACAWPPAWPVRHHGLFPNPNLVRDPSILSAWHCHLCSQKLCWAPCKAPTVWTSWGSAMHIPGRGAARASPGGQHRLTWACERKDRTKNGMKNAFLLSLDGPISFH